MALTKQWGFTEGTSMSLSVSTSPVKPVSEFALVEDEPTQCSMVNKTSSVDLGEKLTYGCRTIPTVSSGLDNIHPGTVSTGVQYQVKLDEQLSVRSDTDPNYRTDLPIVATLTIRHPKDGNIGNAEIGKVVNRLVSACKQGTASNLTWRFEDLMKSALRPTVDLSNS